MKKLSTFFLVLICSMLIACSNNGMKINGRNMNTVNKSIRMIKNRLPTEKRLEYEIAFGIIREANKTDDDFLKAIDDKIPDEVIAQGKEIYQQRKDQGVANYAAYSSWEQMIAQFSKERSEQDKIHSKRERKDMPDDSILYKL